MNCRTVRLIVTAVVAIFLDSLVTLAAYGQPSLAAQDAQTVILEFNGNETSVALIRDAHESKQWYYLRSVPKLTERSRSGEVFPDFRLIRYSHVNPQNESFIEGGLLQFSLTFALDESQLIVLRSKIAEKESIPKEDVVLKLLQINDAKFQLYAGNGLFLNTASLGTGLVTSASSRDLSFMVELKNAGTDLLDSLVKSTSGLPFLIEFHYTAVAPQRNYKIQINWEKTKNLLSTDKVLLQKLTYLERFSHHTQSKVLQEMERSFAENACIEFSTGSSTKSPDDLQTFYHPVMNSVRAALLEPHFSENISINDINAIESETVVQPQTSNTKLPAMRQLTNAQISSLKTEFDFNEHEALTRNTIASGYIGIAGYSDSIQKQVVTSAPIVLDSAYLVLPTVDQRIGVDRVELEAHLRYESNLSTHNSQIVRWTDQTGWKRIDGRSIDLLPIPLLVPGEGAIDLDKLSIDQRVTIESGPNVSKVFTSVKPSVGAQLFQFPAASITSFELDSTLLPWLNIDTQSGTEKVRFVTGELTGIYDDGTKLTMLVDLRPVLKNQNFERPSVHFIIFSNAIQNGCKLTKVVPELRLQLENAAVPIPWSQNSRNLLGNHSANTIFLSLDQFPSN
jgi:hypothetical protein